MSIELVSAIASILTTVVIGATAIVAIVQLRHMRSNNQITALLTVQSEFDAADFREAMMLVRKEFPGILDDAEFCAYFIAALRDQEPIESQRFEAARHAARFVGNTYENIGLLMKRGIVDRELFLDAYGWVIISLWGDLEGYVALVRAVNEEPTLYLNFEYLASIAREYRIKHPELYPHDVKRLEPRVPAAAAKLLK